MPSSASGRFNSPVRSHVVHAYRFALIGNATSAILVLSPGRVWMSKLLKAAQPEQFLMPKPILNHRAPFGAATVPETF